ncbi:MAG: quinone-dependent dihydroorotate dehydrogenase [Saprospirales bacterium]|nr:MAG: quinone-dependent dihydroorotate dehydrogenase [Saprospirales bacterium]
MLYRFFLRPVMFLLSAEKAHSLAMKLFSIGLSFPLISSLIKSNYRSNKRNPRQLMGLNFPNPVGLAAGFDKDGKYFKELQHLGFGFLELGTVTPRPQEGNPKPRLFRLKKDRAIINRMGFNNGGVVALKNKLQKKGDFPLIIGGNIGKNKDTPNENAVEDYLYCMQELHEVVDYFTVNMSSPNTPNLRELQDKEPLRKILKTLLEYNNSTAQPKPILLKIAPDLSDGQLHDIAEIVNELGLDGIIATNTTISRDNLKTNESEVSSIGNGGLSGTPLTLRSREVVKIMRSLLGKGVVIIGVGGIMSGNDAAKMLEAGADLVQIYSGLIYKGPGLVREILREIID